MDLTPEEKRQIVALITKYFNQDEAVAVEPVLNKTRLAKKTGFGTRTIAELMRTGVVPTYEQGKKAKASDILAAMQDRPARMVGQSRARQGHKVYDWKVI